MTQPSDPPKAKKSVALSGVVAGNTAISTVGHTGNDLHYRGYDIADLAAHATYEEVAHRLILEQLPATSHPMNVLRTGCSVLGTLNPEPVPHGSAGPTDVDTARAIAD